METRRVLQDEGVVMQFKSLLKVCGINLIERKNYLLYGALMMAFATFDMLVLGYSMYHFIFEMDSLAVIIHHSILVMDIQVAMVVFYYTRPEMGRLISGMTHSYDYESNLLKTFTDKLEQKRSENMNIAFKCTVFSMVYMQINLIIFAFVEKWTGVVEFMLIFPAWFPFDLNYVPFHVLAYLWEHLTTECIGLTIFGVMALVYLTFSHITTEFTVLCFATSQTRHRAEEMFQSQRSKKPTSNVSLEECYSRSVKQLAKHHLTIIRYYDDTTKVFKFIYLMVFITGLVVCTCTGFTLISDNTALKIKFVGVTIIELVFLYIVCYFGEAIMDQSDLFRMALYDIEWYDMPIECMSTIRLMIERSLRPLIMMAATGQKVNLDSYMSMIKASYSYFNMMLAAQETK